MLRWPVVVWDTTYACPMRCGYCYSESGRRANKSPPPGGVSVLADALWTAGVSVVAFSGGEPLLFPGLFEAARTLKSHNVATNLYTSGFGLTDALADDCVRSFNRIHVSIDSSSSDIHDRIRGRHGSHSAAVCAIDMLVDARGRSGLRAPKVGIELTAIRSNFSEIPAFLDWITRRFNALEFVTVGAAVPSGLATRARYAADELLSEDQLQQLRSASFLKELRPRLRANVVFEAFDNWNLMPRYDLSGVLTQPVPIQIEPDGGVRAFPLYEGTVGNLASEPLETIWERARKHHNLPEVVQLLSEVTTMSDWVVAASKIDRMFASAADLIRIKRRTG